MPGQSKVDGGRYSTRAGELSQRLAQNVQAVCRHYLPAGRREGRFWMVGDVSGAPGRSLYVRLFETERGAIGNWVDAATGEHGDLVDLIRLNQRHGRLAETIDEAERFLPLAPTAHNDSNNPAFAKPVRTGFTGCRQTPVCCIKAARWHFGRDLFPFARHNADI